MTIQKLAHRDVFLIKIFSYTTSLGQAHSGGIWKSLVFWDKESVFLLNSIVFPCFC